MESRIGNLRISKGNVTIWQTHTIVTQIDFLAHELIANKNADDVSRYAHFPGIITEEETLDEHDLETEKYVSKLSAN